MLADTKEEREALWVKVCEQGHLIVAAPETAAERDRLEEVNKELLEVARVVLDCMHKPYAADTTGYGYHIMLSTGFYKQVKGAIAKAKWKSS